METTAQLKNQLRDLRLYSLLENIDQRIEDAVTSKSSYLEFLIFIFQDEIERRKQKKRELKIKKANLGRYKSIIDFDFDFNPKINRQQIKKFVTCDFIIKNQNVFFEGPTGVGKTFLAKAIGFEACNRGFTVLFVRTIKILDDIYAGKSDNTFYKRFKKYTKPDLLILDDWGMRSFQENQLEILNELITERYENGSIVITSNRPIKKWFELFDEPVISSALLDRLLHNSYKVKITGESYRKSIN